jgi:recombination protein RecA
MGKEQQSEKQVTNLEDARKIIRKDYGERSLKHYKKPVKWPTISTGIIALDSTLGGGAPLGRMVEFVGEQSSGKTSLALSIGAEAQKAFPKSYCAYIDAEHALDTQWAAKIGIDFKRFEHCEPEFGEDAMMMMEIYLQTGQCSTIILDSVAAILPKAEIKKDVGEANIGKQAKLVADSLRRINRWLNKNPGTTVMWINQKRAKIAAGPGGGNFNYEPTKATGGKALPFYCTTRFSVRKTEAVKVQEVIVGQKVKVDVLKNKVNNGPGGQVIFSIDNRVGIDKAKEILDLGIADGTIVKGGAWYTFGDEKFQGEDKAKKYIQDNLNHWLKTYKKGS